MSTQTHRTMSGSDKAMLAAYLRLTPENRKKVMIYLEVLKASQYTPAPSADSPH